MRLYGYRAPISIVPIFILVVAVLACGTDAPNVQVATDNPAFSTATPGGSISIWLLTTTPTLEGQPVLVTTPLAPILTATGAAQIAEAQTATAAAPTITPEVFVAPPECPPISAATLPPEAPFYSQYPQTILRFLAAGGQPNMLEVGLRRWAAITNAGGLVNADRDVNGDSAPEIIVIALDPAYIDKSPQPGDLFVFSCANKSFRLIFDAGYSTTRTAPVLLSSEDITGDGLGDLIYMTQDCSPGTCLASIGIAGWNPQAKMLASLIDQPITAYQPSVVLSNAIGLPRDVAVKASINPDPAAGPQRDITTIWRWDGSRFTAAEVLKSPAQYRIHAIHDGDDKLMAGDGEGAIEQYLHAADSSDLLEWGIPNELALLTTFARYRLMLAYTLANHVDQAQLAHDQLVAMYASSVAVPGLPTPVPVVGPQPGIEYANMADLFWQNFAVNRDMARACRGVIEYAQATPSVLAALNSFGYTNRQYTPEMMCPLK